MKEYLRFRAIIFALSAFLVILSVAPIFAQDTAVYQAQQELEKLGYDPGPLDGLWSSQIEEALKRFQEDKVLKLTGVLDDKTRQELGIILLPKQKSCSEIIAEWITNDIDKIAASMGMSPETAQALGFMRGSTVVAPPGCVLLVEGSKVRPYCNGKPLTEDSCDNPQ